MTARLRATALLGLAAVLAALFVTVPSADAATPSYHATIVRTEHGIPHITADDWGSLGFGSGYAAMDTNACTLADVLLTARGERSRYLGPEGRYDDQVSMAGTNLQVDTLVNDIHNRHVVEKLLDSEDAGPGTETREMTRGYAAGVNQWLRDHGGADGITDPACHGADWITPDVTALDIWYGVHLANILASTGNFLGAITDASPPTLTDLGLPSLGQFAPIPDPLPTVEKLLDALLPDADFGSNATAIGGDDTTTGKGMLLGNPHFPWRGRYRFSQQHLTVPGKYDVAGASLIGSPVVNIGWNKDVAWSHTVSTAYRFTPYEYRTLLSPMLYLSGNGLIGHVEKRTVKVTVKQDDGSLKKVTEHLYRTPEGYVIDAPDMLMGWTPLSVFAIRDANAEQLRTVDTFFEMGRATSVRDLIERQDREGGMPWVNTTAADRFGDVVYADHSVVPNVTDEEAAICMSPIGRVIHQMVGLPVLDGTFASSVCAWGTDDDASRAGIFGTANLPAAYTREWVMNANDSYWLPSPDIRLEGYDRIIGCEKCERTLRTQMVDSYVIDALADGGKVSPAELRGFEYENRVRGAELMSENGDLVKVCRAAGGTDACDVLEAWDLHSDADSVGTHIYEEFVKRLPSGGGLLPGPKVWEVPFDPADPVNTPRDLRENAGAVLTAMREALAYLDDRGIPADAPWGTLQVAGDRGAPPIGLGGGLGDQAGNANALASRTPRANTEYYKPITYGSSHIQAISYLPGGGVDARTILTYGQSEDPTSVWSSDQTRMFGDEEWVNFPFTRAQINAQEISSVTVHN